MRHMAVKIDRLDHVNIAAPAELLARVRDFYISVLGLEDGARPAFSSPGFWLYAGNTPVIHLSEKDGRQAGGNDGCFDHVAFRGNDLQGMVSRLESAGIDHRRNYVPEINLYQLFFRDPAGVGVEVNFQGVSE